MPPEKYKFSDVTTLDSDFWSPLMRKGEKVDGATGKLSYHLEGDAFLLSGKEGIVGGATRKLSYHLGGEEKLGGHWKAFLSGRG